MKRNIITLAFTALLSQACTANEPATSITPSFGSSNQLLFSTISGLDVKMLTPDEFRAAMSTEWFKPVSAKTLNDTEVIINKCSQILPDYQNFSAKDPIRWEHFETLKIMCVAIEKTSLIQPSKRSFLPTPLITSDIHKILPREFTPIFSTKEESRLKNAPESTRWADGIKLKEFEKVNEHHAMLYTTEEAQTLIEIARGDFNGDAIEDALFYIRSQINGGSLSTNKMIIVTAGEDGVIKTLAQYPEP